MDKVKKNSKLSKIITSLITSMVSVLVFFNIAIAKCPTEHCESKVYLLTFSVDSVHGVPVPYAQAEYRGSGNTW